MKIVDWLDSFDEFKNELQQWYQRDKTQKSLLALMFFLLFFIIYYKLYQADASWYLYFLPLLTFISLALFVKVQLTRKKKENQYSSTKANTCSRNDRG